MGTQLWVRNYDFHPQGHSSSGTDFRIFSPETLFQPKRGYMTWPNTLKSIAFLFLLISFTETTVAQTPTALEIDLELFASGLDQPVGIYNAGDDRLFIVEQDAGKIEILSATGSSLGTFLNVGNLISNGSERGLLGLAFHPDYQTNGTFFINYTNGSGDTVVASYQVSGNANVADAASGSILLTIDQPAGNHNGGHIAFSPIDGYLYIGMGDGGDQGDPSNLAQNPQEMLGKMLRIDVDGGSPYGIPASNPYVGDASALDEIWSIGLRNPWKFSFDQSTSDLWIGDVGQNNWEEVNFQAAANVGGDNYGWRCYEGDENYNTAQCGPIGDYVLPVAQVSHSNPDSWCSITGGNVYRGSEYEFMNGTYFFTDYCAGDFKGITQEGGSFNEFDVLPNQGFGYVAFGENNAGDLFVANLNGNIMKIKDACGTFMPVITVSNGLLNTDLGTTNYWYQDGELIVDETGNTLVPTAGGSYYSVVENNQGCARASNAIEWTIIGGVLGCTYESSLQYDPMASIDDGSCTFDNVATCIGDLNSDGLVNTSDLLDLLGNYGNICP
ncbi:MAG: glucose/arabinose dehydrogenase [Flavobacteriales bacterium]|jgi:glucose/arabinose dehydrogenase